MLKHAAQQFVRQLPRVGVRWAFCYGSSLLETGVFQGKRSNDLHKRQVDMIVVVKERFITEWHSQNLQTNPHHYSLLWRLLAHPQHSWISSQRGLRLLTRIQRWGPGVWFHPYISSQNLTFKYGIITDNNLIQDLTQWTHLYVAGRLHKPVMEVEINDSELEMTTSVRERDSLIESALFQNRLAAVAVSLLLHWTPSTTTTTTTTTTKSEAPSVTLEETTLYHTLAHLSYLGDVRVGVAEDPHKVTRIVTANLSAFQEIYRPILTRLHQRGLLVLHSHSSTWHITLSRGTEIRRVLFKEFVPKGFQLATIKLLERHTRHDQQRQRERENEGKEEEVLESEMLSNALKRVLQHTVSHSSTVQTLKGLITAGPLRSLRYLLHKLYKRFVSHSPPSPFQ